MKTLARFSAPLTIVLLLLAPLAAAAQTAPPGHNGAPAATTTCEGFAAWYARIPEPDAVTKQISAAPADASGYNYAAQLTILNGIVTQLSQHAVVPAIAVSAQQTLAQGYADAVSSLSLWEQGIQSGAPGGIEGLSQVLNADILQSKSRNEIVEGYRLRADASAVCAVGAGAATGAGCAAVNAWMIPAAAYVQGMWDAIQAEFDAAAKVHAANVANPELINPGSLLAPPETWTNFFFGQALTLAAVPAPAEAAAVKQEEVAQLIGESDLYLLDMMGIWTGYLGGDAETSQQISDAYTTQSNTLTTGFTKLQTDWTALAKTCGSPTTIPNPPPITAPG